MDDVRDPGSSVSLEWLATNGLGGFAMGTALGANTRRYHGLLVAALHPPLDRALLLHSVVEQIVLDDEVIDLATHEFEDALHPEGWRHLVRFNAEPPYGATWLYRRSGVDVRKELRLTPEHNRLTLRYEIDTERPCTLRLRPLTPLRDFHELRSENDGAPDVVRQTDDGIAVAHGRYALALETAGGGTWRVEPQWWRDFVYREERARGQAWRESVWSPGVYEMEIASGAVQAVELVAAADGEAAPGVSDAEASGATSPGTTLAPDPISRLHAAADQFIVRRTEPDRIGFSIIAGYPWFADWGRDAMISLPGLMLTRGRLLEAGSTLRTFARHVKRGIIPNRFDDFTNEPHYNTVDASLWFVNGVREYVRTAPDDAHDLMDACRAVVNAYRIGAAPYVKITRDGLLWTGTPETQITWMDAERDGVVFTPRHGKAIEINALWHNALCCLAEMTGDEREESMARELAGQVALGIQMSFWWAERRCCHDVLVPDHESWTPDGRLRPNQIIAASLPFSPLTDLQRRDVIDVVRERLLTPYGLRTLDPDDPDYRGRFEGDMAQRDSAYHQGTVWPWLIGPFCEAILRAGNFSPAARAEVEHVLAPLIESLDSGCLGQLAEVYDGDPPHRAAGCPAQAWSVAEVLRVMHLAVAPAPERTATLHR